MKKLLSILLVALVLASMSINVFADVEIQSMPKSNHKIKEAVYYDKNPNPNAEGEMAEYPAVWMLYDDPDNHTNDEVFVLKEVGTQEEAKNTDFGIDGFCINGKWYKVVGLWTVNPGSDIIDKGNGEKAVFTPLYYSEADKPQAGETVQVALYDYEANEGKGGISNLLDIVIPIKGGQYEVVAYDTTEPDTTEETNAETTAQETTAETSAEVTTEATESTAIEETTAPVTTEATEPTTVEATEASTESPQATTDAPQPTTEAPEATTAPIQPTTEAPKPATDPVQPTTSGQVVIIDNPTEAPTLPVVTEIVTPTTPGGNASTQPTTSGDSVIENPTNPVTQPATVEPSQPAIVEPTQPATEEPTQPVTDAPELKVSVEKSKIKIGEYTAIKVEGGLEGLKITSENTKIAIVDKDGKIKGVSKGKTTIIVDNGAQKKSIGVVVEKKDSKFAVKGIKLKASSKKKTKFKLGKTLTIKNAAGKVTFKRVKGSKKIKIKKSGTLTVPKGLKKGKKYTLKIKLTDAGNKTTAGKSTTIKVTITIKK